MPAIQGTLTRYSTEFKPAKGFYIGAPIWQLTATGSGSGDSSSSSTTTRAKSGTGSGIGSGSSSGTRIVLRDAIGSGLASDAAVISGSNQLRLGYLTDFTFGFTKGGGRFYVGSLIYQQSATGSGTGDSSSTGISTRARTATGSGLGTQSSTGVRIVLRDATGSGIGGDFAVIAGSNQLRLGYLTDFTFGFKNGGGRFYLGPANYYVTASGSGIGSESATFIRGLVRSATGSGFAGESTSTDLEILFRSATGSATSSSEADPFLSLIRQATGSGVGAASVVFIRGHIRSSSGSGLGSGTGVRLVLNIRTASGSGTGSQISSGRLVAIRTASASGEGTASSVSIELLPRTANGDGVGATSENATWSKSRIFRVPQTTTYSFTRWMGESTSDRLFSHVPPLIRAENLFKTTTGEYTINNPGLEDTAKIYHGAHNIFLDDTEVAELTAAGYGAYIT